VVIDAGPDGLFYISKPRKRPQRDRLFTGIERPGSFVRLVTVGAPA